MPFMSCLVAGRCRFCISTSVKVNRALFRCRPASYPIGMAKISHMLLWWWVWMLNTIYVHDPAVVTHPLRVGIGDFDLAWLERDEEYAVLTLAGD